MQIISCLLVLLVNTDVTAQISYLVGDATVTRNETLYKAVLNAQLQVNDIITTQSESECEIKFEDYSLVHLGPNSSIRIERKEKTDKGVFHRIFMSLGTVVTKVTKLNKNDEYEMRTEAAQAFIRGTTFKTDIDSIGGSTFSVFEGAIAVKSLLEGAKEILVNEKVKSVIKKGELEPLVDQLSDLEIADFTERFQDFINRGAVLDSLRARIEEKIDSLQEKKDDLIDDGKKKLKDLFK